MPKRSRQPLTDDEFVAQIRHQPRTARRVAKCLSVLYSAFIITLCLFIRRSYHSFYGSGDDPQPYQRGFGLGLVLGAFQGFALFSAIWHLVDSLMTAFGPHRFRMHRLLIKYYDLASGAKHPER